MYIPKATARSLESVTLKHFLLGKALILYILENGSVIVYQQAQSEMIFISHFNVCLKNTQSRMGMHWILEHPIWAPQRCDLWPLFLCFYVSLQYVYVKMRWYVSH